MNGDTMELAQMMVEMERRLSDKVSDVHACVKGLDGRMTTAVAAAKEAQAAFRVELLGDGGRVAVLEDELRNERMWSNVRTVVIVPVVFALHKLGAVLGIKL